MGLLKIKIEHSITVAQKEWSPIIKEKECMPLKIRYIIEETVKMKFGKNRKAFVIKLDHINSISRIKI